MDGLEEALDELLDVEDQVLPALLGSDQSIDADQCWGAALSRCCGFRDGECTPGFKRGKNHLKNKFCDNCRGHGVFVRADQVRTLSDDNEDFSNKHGAGLWTAMQTFPPVGFRVINQSHKCKGPRLLLFDTELLPVVTSSLAPPDDAYVINGRWLHLRLSNGTLVPSLAHEIVGVSASPLWAATQRGACEDDERGTKRARLPTSVSTTSPSSPDSSPRPQEWASLPNSSQAGSGTHEQPPPRDDAPPLDALIAAHADFGALIRASLDAPGASASLTDGQRAGLLALVQHVHASAALLGGGGRGDPSADGRGDPSADGLALGVELLSWPPSPPGTGASGRRPTPSQTTAWGVDPRPPNCERHHTGGRDGRQSQPVAPYASTTTTTTTTPTALLYLYFLILCASTVLGHAMMGVLTFWFPQLCEGPHYDAPPTLVVYACMGSVIVAVLLLLAEVVGLLPTRCATPHFLHPHACTQTPASARAPASTLCHPSMSQQTPLMCAGPSDRRCSRRARLADPPR